MRYSSTLISAFISTAAAHTWIEQLMVIAPNGTMVGEPGYPRGNVKRGTPGFGDPAMVNLIPGNDRPINQILPDDPICKSTQMTASQTDGSPRLQAAAGDNIALRYQENGHVSLPSSQPGKPENRGTLYVYGTTQPQENDALLSIHRVWNAEGTGGDGRGVLLSTQNYDDGQCYQVNGGEISVSRQKTFAHTANPLMGADLWCQQDIQIPPTAPSSRPYTLYWVWDWPTMPGTEGFPDGKQEIYTTCMDVDIAAGGQSAGTQNRITTNAFVKGQDLGNAAIASQVADITNPMAVTGKFIPFSGLNSGISSTAPPASSHTRQAEPPFTRTRRPRPSAFPFDPQDPTHSDRGFGGSSNRNDNTATAISNSDLVSTTTVIAQAASTITQINSVFQTITQTKLETIFVTANQRRAVPTDLAATDYPSVRACSQTEPIYRLRARKPFYILPQEQVRPDAGC